MKPAPLEYLGSGDKNEYIMLMPLTILACSILKV